MSLNKIVLQGKIPFFEGVYKESEKSSYYFHSISVKRDYKAEGEKYYPEDLIPFKAFGAIADHINKYFKQGDYAIIEGRLSKDNDYTNKDGELIKGQYYVQVEKIYFSEGSNNNNGENKNTTKKPQKSSNPLNNTSKSNNPLSKKKSPWG